MLPSAKKLGFTLQDARRWRLHAIIPAPDFIAYREKQLKELKPLAQHDLLEHGGVLGHHLRGENPALPRLARPGGSSGRVPRLEG